MSSAVHSLRKAGPLSIQPVTTQTGAYEYTEAWAGSPAEGWGPGNILTEAAERWLYGREPLRDVRSTAAAQATKAVI